MEKKSKPGSLGSLGPVIAVCIPSRGIGHMPTIYGVQRELESGPYEHIRPYFFSFYRGLPQAHNHVVHKALQHPNVTHLWIVEDDHLLPVGILAALLERRAPVVSGQYQFRSGGTMASTHPRSGEVVMVPTGCLLVERQVFNKLPHPPFQRSKYILKNGEWEQTTRLLHTAGDIFFSAQCRELGIPMEIVWEPEVGHLNIVDHGDRSLTGVDNVTLIGGSGDLEWEPPAKFNTLKGKVRIRNPGRTLVIDIDTMLAKGYIKKGWTLEEDALEEVPA